MRSRYFVGVGIDRYELTEFEDLQSAFDEVQQVGELLSTTHHVALSNPAAHDELYPSLEQAEKVEPDSLIVMWSGHGLNSGGLRLVLPGRRHGEPASEVIYRAMHTRARQILIIFDVCQAGAALQAQSLFDTLSEQLFFDSQPVWCGLLMSCTVNDVGARDGRFGQLITKLLRDGPDDPELAMRWTQYNELIRGDDLADAVLKEWTDTDQSPLLRFSGNAQRMLPNPLYRPGVRGQVAEHLVRATRSGDESEIDSWFTGRTDEVNRIVGWVTSGVPGIRLVTGSAGTGKSSLLNKVISATDPTERERLLITGQELGHDDPGESSIAAGVRIRCLTADEVSHEIDRELIAGGLLLSLTPSRITDGLGQRNASQLVGDLQAIATSRAQPPVLILDGLDEALDQVFDVVDGLLVRLAPVAIVIVSSRPLVNDQGEDLAELLSPLDIIDLDSPEHHESGRQAVAAFVESRLAGVSEVMDPAAVANEILNDDASFIRTRIIVDQLRAEPIDTSEPNWRMRLASSVADALESDLAAATEPPGDLGLDAARLGRDMLTALTWGLGSGFPEEEWLTVASALSGAELDRKHASWALDQLGRYIDQAGDQGVAVHQIAHRSVTEYLRPDLAALSSTHPSAGLITDPVTAELVATALLNRYAELIDAGVPAQSATYLWHWARVHAAQAGSAGLTQLADLASRSAPLIPDLGSAYLMASQSTFASGDAVRAKDLSTQAISIFRDLVATDVLHRDSLAASLSGHAEILGNLGEHHEAIEPSRHALQLLLELAEEDLSTYQVNLVGAISNLAIRHARIGEYHDACAMSEWAVEHFRTIAEENPAYRADLAGALTNLGNHYSHLGRRHEAYLATNEAVSIYRTECETQPALLPELATALGNLSVRLQDIGEFEESLRVSQESAEHLQPLLTASGTQESRYASALLRLSTAHRYLGHHHDAVRYSRQAVDLLRRLASSNPGLQSSLANALNNLGVSLSALGDQRHAAETNEESIAILRPLAEKNEVHRQDLANAINSLSVSYSSLGRHHEALAASHESAAIFDELAQANSVFEPEFAGVLANLSLRYVAVGRHFDAVAPSKNAVELLQGLVASNPAFRANLARALDSLGVCYGSLGWYADAIGATNDAIALLRELVTEDSSTNAAADLAGALANLGLHLSSDFQFAESIVASGESIAIFRNLVEQNPKVQVNLANALCQLGIALTGLDRYEEALTATEESVTRLRTLVLQNPVLKTDLAHALNCYGIQLSKTNQLDNAISVGDESLAICLELALQDPTMHLQNVAVALSNLEKRFIEIDRVDQADHRWQSVLDLLLEPERQRLLLFRAEYSKPGDLAAAPWLRGLHESGPVELQANVRQLARYHYNHNPADWANAWDVQGSGQLPDWLTLDLAHLELAQSWIVTNTFDEEFRFLNEHPELLGTEYDLAIAESLAPLEPDEAHRLAALRWNARQIGVEDAYQPLLLQTLAMRFAKATAAEQAELLSTHGDELRSEAAAELLFSAPEVDGERDDALLALAILQLDATLPPETFHEVISACEDPGQFESLFAAQADQIDAQSLFSMAALALDAALSPVHRASALIYLAIGEVALNATNPARDQHSNPTESLRKAISISPSNVPKIINEIARLGTRHPAALRLIPIVNQLSKESPDE